MTKLLHISANTYPPLDGKHHHTKNIWKELAQGFDEYHILARSETHSYSYSNEENIHLHLVPKLTQKSKIFFFTSFWMFWIIKKYKITYLLSQCPIVGGFTASLASKFFKIPLMVEVHGEVYFTQMENNFFIKYFANNGFKKATKIRSLGSSMTNSIKKYVSLDKIVEIPTRVNFELFKFKKEDFEIKDNVKVISIGRFHPDKGYDRLIKACSKLKNILNKNITLTIIGGGEQKEYYIELATNLNFEKNLVLYDWLSQEDFQKYVVSSDIYVQSSILEGLPRTILEAMAMQMPIITTNIGVITDVILDNENGLVIEKDSIEALLKSIEHLIENQKFRESLALNAYLTAKEKYEWKNVFEKYRNEILTMEYKK
jgi:glycosyltransferase involved in cell wall biosynthesis